MGKTDLAMQAKKVIVFIGKTLLSETRKVLIPLLKDHEDVFLEVVTDTRSDYGSRPCNMTRLYVFHFH